jgi:hypothetical protein
MARHAVCVRLIAYSSKNARLQPLADVANQFLPAESRVCTKRNPRANLRGGSLSHASRRPSSRCANLAGTRLIRAAATLFRAFQKRTPEQPAAGPGGSHYRERSPTKLKRGVRGTMLGRHLPNSAAATLFLRAGRQPWTAYEIPFSKKIRMGLGIRFPVPFWCPAAGWLASTKIL